MGAFMDPFSASFALSLIFPAFAAVAGDAAVAIVESAWIASTNVSCAQLGASISAAGIRGLDVATAGMEIADNCFLPTNIAHVGALRALEGVTLEPDRTVRVAPLQPDDNVSVNGHTDNGHVRRLQGAEQATSPRSWGLDRIDQPALPLDGLPFSASSRGAGATIYVIDTGVYAAHADFGGRAKMAADFIGEKPAGDNHGHGTHVTGTAIGATLGVARGARVSGVKVLDRMGSGTITGVIKGIEWAVRDAKSARRPGVLSMSLGGGFSHALNQAALSAGSAGNVVVLAAGNSAADACYYSPAGAGGRALDTGVLTISASTPTDSLAFFSNTGRCVDIGAPGLNILSASNLGRTATRTMSGTSMSAPHVSGVAALLLEKHRFNRTAAVRELLSIARGGALSNCPVSTPNKLLQVPGARAAGDPAGGDPAAVPSMVPTGAPTSFPDEPEAPTSDSRVLAPSLLLLSAALSWL